VISTRESKKLKNKRQKEERAERLKQTLKDAAIGKQLVNEKDRRELEKAKQKENKEKKKRLDE